MTKPRHDQGPDYERGFVDGMQHQMQSSVDKAVNRMAQPEQEPVAWMHWLHGPVRLFMNKDEATLELERLNREYPVDKDHRKMRPLVFGDTTSPQRTWIGLDFETIEECFPEGPSVFEDAYGDNHTSPRWLHAFARAIESRLKEKNR